VGEILGRSFRPLHHFRHLTQGFALGWDEARRWRFKQIGSNTQPIQSYDPDEVTMTVWCLATYSDFLATSLFLTQYDAYEELAQQLYGEDAELPDEQKLEALLYLLGPKKVYGAQPRLQQSIIAAFEDAAIEVGIKAVVDLHSQPWSFAQPTLEHTYYSTD
jgi:hypothetical protein